jgi:hypothetical protein
LKSATTSYDDELDYSIWRDFARAAAAGEGNASPDEW